MFRENDARLFEGNKKATNKIFCEFKVFWIFQFALPENGP